jgi:hypothetical protein
MSGLINCLHYVVRMIKSKMRLAEHNNVGDITYACRILIGKADGRRTRCR